MSIIRPTNLLPLATAAVWIVFLLYLTTTPRRPYVPFLSSEVALPVAHYVGHLVLAAVLYLSVRGVGRQPPWLAGLVAVSISTGISLAIEGVQAYLPDRGTQLADVLFGLLGTLSAVGVLMAAERARMMLPRLSLGVAGLTALVMALVGASMLVWGPDLPRVDDHWHADYTITICGEALEPLPGTPGHVHTHGSGVIHVHPHERRYSLRNATLALFFETSDGALTDTSIALPTGETYSNGDSCPGGGRGEVAVAVNGERIDNPSSYVPKRNDEIHISFQSEGDLFFIR